MLRKQAGKVMGRVKWKGKLVSNDDDDNHNKAIVPKAPTIEEQQKVKFVWKWGIGKFVLSGIVAYVDGRLCRSIPNPIARRIVSGFLLSFLDKDENEWISLFFLPDSLLLVEYKGMPQVFWEEHLTF